VGERKRAWADGSQTARGWNPAYPASPVCVRFENLFLTTNHLERLDPALIRPGRVDLKELIDDATPHHGHADPRTGLHSFLDVGDELVAELGKLFGREVLLAQEAVDGWPELRRIAEMETAARQDGVDTRPRIALLSLGPEIVWSLVRFLSRKRSLWSRNRLLFTDWTRFAVGTLFGITPRRRSMAGPSCAGSQRWKRPRGRTASILDELVAELGKLFGREVLLVRIEAREQLGGLVRSRPSGALYSA
jgi:hypothetical protein